MKEDNTKCVICGINIDFVSSGKEDNLCITHSKQNEIAKAIKKIDEGNQ